MPAFRKTMKRVINPAALQVAQKESGNVLMLLTDKYNKIKKMF